jgi:hypothetical protein
MIPGLKTPDGALYCTTVAPAAGDPVSGGVTMTPDGWVRANANSPQKWDQGKGFLTNGALCVDVLGSAVVGYVNGLPVTATGALKCQLNTTPVAADTYVGGLRVGPLGGLYIVDAAPAFSPADLFLGGTQGAWFDPSDFSTMFQDSAGSIPVTGVGQPVGLIKDKSGRGNNAIQATAASRPVLQIDANSKYYLEFDGVDDFLLPPSTILSSANQGTETHGARRILPNGSDGAVMCNFGTGIDSHEPFSGVTFYSSFLSASRPAFGTILIDSNYVLTQVKDTTTLGVRYNGAQSGSIAAVTSGLGAAPSFCKNTTGNLFYRGRIYSIIVRGALSTAQEITDTETWVASKTGVTLP